MRILGLFAIGVCVVLGACAQDITVGNPFDGAAFFESQSCLQCHSFSGKGATGSASDLGRRIGRDYTPAMMAALLWNHAPAMWDAMRNRGVASPEMNESQARDLFAFFYVARYFDKLGDAGRGKQVFAENGCAGCHGVGGNAVGGAGRTCRTSDGCVSVLGLTLPPRASPVVTWRSLSDPITLAQEMWNHAANRRLAEAAGKGERHPLTTQGMTDLMVYLQNLPELRGRPLGYSLKLTPASGPMPRAESCGHAQCHSSRSLLEARLKNVTLTDLAVAMWNHKPKTLQTQPALARSDVATFVTNVWAVQFFQESGSATRGQRVFVKKGCASCHDGSGSAPNLGGQARSAISIVTTLWNHGPRISDEMRRRNISWPRFNADEMTDLITYLNSLSQPPQPLLLRAAILPAAGGTNGAGTER